MDIFQHLTNQRLLAFKLALPAAIAASVIVYLLIGAEGPTWAGSVLDGVLFAAVGLNLSCYLFLWIQPRKRLFFAINTAFSILMIFGFLRGVAICFPGIGTRYGNCGTEVLYVVAFVNLIVVFIVNLHIWPAFLTALVLAFPAVSIAAHFYIVAPLFRELRFADLSATCHVRSDGTAATRIASPSDADPGLFVGEHAPRIIKIAGGKRYRWLYTSRRFSVGVTVTAPPDVCE